ncbi:hypothetical protein FAM23877_11445 [Propionibacterium freudenreichii]|uniref:hypothetical protein n=1 Tax=Propionibacterium freudenreichii TaxID=1744 RepID=UPI0024853755|nr:hypothetical protein [Propionibacterium freudenreichii]WGU90248.1 hypothetical protein FAM23877_11445 [Propionibacterium freudenreichii]
MGKKGRARLRLDAVNYLQPVTLAPLDEELAACLVAAKSSSPICSEVQARSDLSFTDTILSTLTRVELGLPTAQQGAYQLLANPSTALRKARKGGVVTIRQALLVQHPTEELCVRISISVEVEPGLPPSITLTSCDARLVDMASADDKAALVAELEEWAQEFTEPQVGPAPPQLSRWAILGDPTQAGFNDLPEDWKARLIKLGTVYGRDPILASSLSAAKQAHVEQQSKLGFILPKVQWIKDLGGDVSSFLRVPNGNHSFEQLLNEIRADILRQAGEQTAPLRQRALVTGEVVYHRKVGDSGGGKDTFDEGSPTPCSHGASSFESWTKADKAAKGMRARYSNFEDSMLLHCSKYPNCGMYAVDASRGKANRQAS